MCFMHAPHTKIKYIHKVIKGYIECIYKPTR